MVTGLISGWAFGSQHTPPTLGCLLAYPGTVTHNQSVILIEHLTVMREVFHENPLAVYRNGTCR